MRIGIDYRSALINAEGIGRYVRELVGLNKVQGKPFTVSEIAFTIRELVG